MAGIRRVGIGSLAHVVFLAVVIILVISSIVASGKVDNSFSAQGKTASRSKEMLPALSLRASRLSLIFSILSIKNLLKSWAIDSGVPEGSDVAFLRPSNSFVILKSLF